MKGKSVEIISECFIKPKYEVEEFKQIYHLGPMELPMLSFHYIQKGLLFNKPNHLKDEDFSIHTFLDTLKNSLSLTLVHYYPLAGRFVTRVNEDRHECLVYVDCNKGPGVRFIHASLDMTMSDILSPTNVPVVVQSFFDHDRVVNHEGHSMPLLSIQVTELVDGVFIGCSMNHVPVDGTSYWHFWNVWSTIQRANSKQVVPAFVEPVYEPLFPHHQNGPELTLPFTNPDEFVRHFDVPPLRERIFHFSSDSLSKLKIQANLESNNHNSNISSFQALSSLCWRSIIRANRVPLDQVTNCRLAANNRHRFDPPLPQEYFRTSVNALKASTTAGELLEQSLGWSATLLNQAVANHTDKSVCDHINGWLSTRYVYNPITMFDPYSVMMGSSPRFDMYGNEFGLGKAVAVRSGYANKFVGKVTAYPGCEGEGSVDLEICLSPDSMAALESDQEFMNVVSLTC